jgi:hypothetical protein
MEVVKEIRMMLEIETSERSIVKKWRIEGLGCPCSAIRDRNGECKYSLLTLGFPYTPRIYFLPISCQRSSSTEEIK